jgi:predicted ATPase
MRRFIVTGAPGAGKTAIIRQLELDGFSVVEEAATDIIAAAQARGIAEPWTDPSFIDLITNLLRQRQIRASYQPDEIQFHDRSVVCTAALAVYLGHPVFTTLARELERIKTEAIFQNRVFFIRNLGFIRATEARRISFEDALRFERIHEEAYRRYGFKVVSIEPGLLQVVGETITAETTVGRLSRLIHSRPPHVASWPKVSSPVAFGHSRPCETSKVLDYLRNLPPLTPVPTINLYELPSPSLLP